MKEVSIDARVSEDNRTKELLSNKLAVLKILECIPNCKDFSSLKEEWNSGHKIYKIYIF